jgi:ornithine decarboxylase
MTASTADHVSTVDAPLHWPQSMPPGVLADIELPTPFLVSDLTVVAHRFRGFMRAMPSVRPYYAVKCNPSAPILRTAAAEGAGFEIASLGELRMLQSIGVDPAEVLYSNTVKPASHVEGAAKAGLWRFSVDSDGELKKIARHAPGAAVYVRLAVDDTDSVFPLSRKFGTDAGHARALLLEARRLGLEPYGLTFHVGSQCVAPTAWAHAIAGAADVMRDLEHDGIRLRMLNIGGGFPAGYGAPVPGIDHIGAITERALAKLLPYQPEIVVAEPGRHMVAETAVMVTSVLGRAHRAGEDWLYVDASAFHGFMETQQGAGGWQYPLWTSRPEHARSDLTPFTVTGPTCDSGDTMFHGVLLPSGMQEGDRLYVASAGAYTLSYASHFNGFPPPRAHFVVS